MEPKQWLIMTLRQAIFNEVSDDIIGQKMTRARMRTAKRKIIKTILLEAQRLGIKSKVNPPGGWDEYLDKLVGDALQKMREGKSSELAQAASEN